MWYDEHRWWPERGLMYFDPYYKFRGKPKCNICGEVLPRGNGMWVYRYNQIITLRFCSQKCADRFVEMNAAVGEKVDVEKDKVQH